jgi:hypothetical protein
VEVIKSKIPTLRRWDFFLCSGSVLAAWGH